MKLTRSFLLAAVAVLLPAGLLQGQTVTATLDETALQPDNSTPTVSGEGVPGQRVRYEATITLSGGPVTGMMFDVPAFDVVGSDPVAQPMQAERLRDLLAQHLPDVLAGRAAHDLASVMRLVEPQGQHRGTSS